MAKEERERLDIYWICVKEYRDGLRFTLEKYTSESGAGALKKYEDLIMEYTSYKGDKKILIEVQYISQGKFSTLKERHINF